jgi:hypothetical protein
MSVCVCRQWRVFQLSTSLPVSPQTPSRPPQTVPSAFVLLTNCFCATRRALAPIVPHTVFCVWTYYFFIIIPNFACHYWRVCSAGSWSWVLCNCWPAYCSRHYMRGVVRSPIIRRTLPRHACILTSPRGDMFVFCLHINHVIPPGLHLTTSFSGNIRMMMSFPLHFQLHEHT